MGLTLQRPRQFLALRRSDLPDKEPEQGILHLDDVKLSSDGEDIGLTAADGTTIIDSYTFGAQTTDVSEGRMPDGGTTWQFFNVPTPGAMNE